MTLCNEDAARLSSWAHDALVRAERYVLSRQSLQGGFCFYRYDTVDEPNVRDTYYAIESLKLLGVSIPEREKAIDFLMRAQLWGTPYLYDYAFSLELLGARDRIGEEALGKIRALKIIPAPEGQCANLGAWLRLTYKILRLRRHFLASFGDSEGQERIAELLMQWVTGVAKTIDLLNAYDVMRIVALLGLPVPVVGIRRFIESVEQLPFGFTVTVDSSSPRLDVVFAGVSSCGMLAMQVRHPTEALQFALSCQTEGGGFANAPVALPNLEATYQGLAVVTALLSGRICQV